MSTEFGSNVDEHARRVFRSAVLGGYFTVYDAERREKAEFATFPQALRYAIARRRSLLYAVAPMGSAAIPRSVWNEYAKTYMQITGRTST